MNPSACPSPTSCEVATCTSGHCGTAPAADGTACGAAAACNGDTLDPASTCDGAGHCAVGTPAPCSPYACAAAACLTSCTKNGNCAAGAYCDTTTNNCHLEKNAGAACTTNAQCVSGTCDVRCCNTTCAGACSVCDTTGACVPAAADEQTAGCSGAKACDGMGNCLAGDGQSCPDGGAPECASGSCNISLDGGVLVEECCGHANAACAGAGDCCSGTCTGGECHCSAASGSCVTAADCCGSVPCNKTGILSSVCCQPNAVACTTNTDCCSGDCAGGLCKCIASGGGPCSFIGTNFCCSGTCAFSGLCD